MARWFDRDKAVVGALTLLAGAMAVTGGCASRSAPRERAPTDGRASRSWPDEPAPAERTAPTRNDASRYGALQRPDLSADWNWSGQALPSGDPATSVISIENVSPANVNLNADYDCTIRVRNVTSQTHVTDVVVTDRLPETGYQFTSASPAAERSGNVLTWNVGHLAPGEVRSLVVRGRATSEGMIKECASVAYTPLVCAHTTVVSAGLGLEKFAPADVLQCDDIALRFVVRNPGTGETTGVRILDTLPEGWTVAGRTSLEIDVGTLKGGETREFTAVARSGRTGAFVNHATATAAGGLNADASAPTVVRRPKLEITKSAGTKMQILGRDTVFTIIVTNTGDGEARDLVLTDSVTGADRIVAASDGGSVAGSTVTWKLGTLAPGANRTVRVTASRASVGRLSDTATATAYGAEPVSATAAIEYRGIPAVLLEVVDDPDPVLVGGTTTYTVTVTNQGTSSDEDIIVTCRLEDAVEFVSAQGATAATHEGGTITFGSLASLAPKQVARWTVTVRGVTEGDTRFKVALNTHETGRSIDESEATRVYK